MFLTIVLRVFGLVSKISGALPLIEIQFDAAITRAYLISSTRSLDVGTDELAASLMIDHQAEINKQRKDVKQDEFKIIYVNE